MELRERYLAAKRRLFDVYFASELNPEQRQAVWTLNGPLLILAGAGSGKTTVLVKRIAFMIKYGNAYESNEVPEEIDEASVADMERAASFSHEEIGYILPEFITEPCPPYAVLAFTFTNKAAGEIRDRLRTAFADNEGIADEIWAGTFHSVCVRILRRYADRLGYLSSFSIYDTDEKKRLTLDCMKQLNIDEKILPVRTVMNEISRYKDELKGPADVEQKDLRSRQIARIFAAYEDRLKVNNAFDFDDLISKTVSLLENEEDVRAYYQHKFRYLSVDEYQDTNYAQFRLTELLSGGTRNLMVVGDDDQSIYKFRGATIENILQFDRLFPDARVVKLEQNYRSTKTILAAANAVIAHNTDRHEKTLWSSHGDGEKITLYAGYSQEDEAEYLLDSIMKIAAAERRHYRDFAVLYRVNEMARVLETAFAKSGIPYRVLGGQRFYDRKEIRDIIAYLVTVANPKDSQKLTRIINEPKRKIGDATVSQLTALAEEEGIPVSAVLANVDAYPALAKAAPALKKFYQIIEDLRKEEGSVSHLITYTVEHTGYLQMLTDMGEEGKTKIDAVNELISAAVEYEKRTQAASLAPTLSGFLEEVALVSDVDKYDETADAVVLMTVHSAKGLEFPIVYIAGMEEGIFPGSMAIGDREEMAEERRLAYVAITRAKEKLIITCARHRLLYGRPQENPLSRFVAREMPPALIETAARRTPAPFDAGRFGTQPSPKRGQEPTYRHPSVGKDDPRMAEFFRRANVGGGVQEEKKKAPARPPLLKSGTRVSHAVFGEGSVVSSADMGGDVLYTVAFDNGQTKKLMATFAHLVVKE